MSLLLTSYVSHLNNVPLLERKPILSEIQVIISFPSLMFVEVHLSMIQSNKVIHVIVNESGSEFT